MIRQPGEQAATGGATWGDPERFAYATLNALSEHVAVLDARGTVVAVNRVWREFAGANSLSMEGLGEGANYFAACESAKGSGAEDAARFADGLRAVISGELEEFSLEYPCHSPTRQRWFISRATRFEFEGEVRAVVTHANITKRKLAEDALRESEEWLRAIFDASRDGILVEDNARIVYVNSAYARLFGYDDPDELKGTHISAVLSAAAKERLLDYGKRRMQGKAAPTVYEFQGKRKDGEIIDLEASVSISNVGGKAYITTAVRDIAERKRAEAELRGAYDELEGRVEERTAELARANATLKEENVERLRAEESRKELLRRLVTAQEEERRRISRELHDQMGQQLAALMMGLKRLDADSYGRQSALHTLRQLQSLTDQLSREVHSLAWGLRPPALDDLGLHTAIYNYVEEWAERSRVPVDFHSAGFGEGRLPFSHETALYRIAQEALTNIFKHSGADRVSFILERRGDHVLAVVEDNGKGFDVEALLGPTARGRRLGLLGMRERATLLGGTLNIESSPGAGTGVFVRIPLDEAHEEGGLRRE